MKKILVPTDFSQTAGFAASSASTLAKKIDGEIIFFHVFEKEPDADAEEKLIKISKEAPFDKIRTSYEITTGNPTEKIIEKEVDYIVIGGVELHGLKGFFTHTVAEKVAKSAKSPVITVKQHTDLSNPKSIVYPTDMRGEQSSIIPYIADLQKLYKAHLHLVKVYDDDFILKKDLEKRLKDFAEFHGLSDYSVTAIEGSNEADEIQKFALELGASLIAMATHDRKGLGRLIGGYISGEILKESKIAILTKVVED